MPTPPIRDDSAVYPEALIAQALGKRCVYELQKAAPQIWRDPGTMGLDNFSLNYGALGYWLFHHFHLNIFNNAGAARVVDVDALAERIRIRMELGQHLDYRIPHWCYLNLINLPGDERPARWSGIPRPGQQEKLHDPQSGR